MKKQLLGQISRKIRGGNDCGAMCPLLFGFFLANFSYSLTCQAKNMHIPEYEIAQFRTNLHFKKGGHFLRGSNFHKW